MTPASAENRHAHRRPIHATVHPVAPPIPVPEPPLERRRSVRMPQSLEITVQPLDDDFAPRGESYFAITRDVSEGGLSFLASKSADFEYAMISLNDVVAPAFLCRVCNTSSIDCTGPQKFSLTNLEYVSSKAK